MVDDDLSGGFETFARSARRWLHREAYRLCGDWHEAEDLTQMTLYKLYVRWDRLSRQGQLFGYARQALLHVYISERRRARWRRETSTVYMPDDVRLDPPVDDRLALATALGRLGLRQRSVIALRFWHDLSVEQTAQVLGCSVGTVTSQTHRALRNLRTLLAERR